MMDIPSRLLLDIRNLKVDIAAEHGIIQAVNGLSLKVPKGGALAIIGESGCGKTVTALSILRLIEPAGRIVEGEILFAGMNGEDDRAIDLAMFDPDSQEIRQIRGKGISMIFQEPVMSLTPIYQVGEQIMESLQLHMRMNRAEAIQRALDLLAEVGIPSPDHYIHAYPHQLSGGMCQRVMIAMAIACQPSLLIADEPTTALDVTIQAQTLDLLKKLQAEYGTAILLITHDLGVASDLADSVAVMYLGRIVESGAFEDVLENPLHPYTRGLLASIPHASLLRGQRLSLIPGTVPEYDRIPIGCPFRNRCPEEMNICRSMPSNVEVESGHAVACWLHIDEGGDI